MTWDIEKNNPGVGPISEWTDDELWEWSYLDEGYCEEAVDELRRRFAGAVKLGPEKDVPDEEGWWLGKIGPCHFHAASIPLGKGWDTDGPWRKLLLEPRDAPADLP
ncbi:MAG: hypothetical protein H8E31_11565 [Planctomycetes bacterium]|nr:hypothetical protein [Planctomycetota bacterium]